MISFSELHSRLYQRALNLGYNPTLPDVNVEFILIDGDTTANGSKEIQRRMVSVGSSIPKYQNISLWLNPLHRRLYRFNNYGDLYLCNSTPQAYETDGGVAFENGPLLPSDGAGPTFTYTVDTGTAGGSGNNGVFSFPDGTKFLLSV